MQLHARRRLKSVALQILGWLLVVIGIAALVLPGPGLLALFAGMAVLSTQYEWARRRLTPVKAAALRTAADSVASTPRILASVLGVAILLALGITWGLRPPVPSWWPMAERWWLLGGWGTGATLILSGLLAAGTIIYSYQHFRAIRRDDAVERQSSGLT